MSEPVRRLLTQQYIYVPLYRVNKLSQILADHFISGVIIFSGFNILFSTHDFDCLIFIKYHYAIFDKNLHK